LCKKNPYFGSLNGSYGKFGVLLLLDDGRTNGEEEDVLTFFWVG
jgi:hypothetical protein